ncbi:MAG: tRNA N6-adenosine threonylcarbamoyltransferase [Firmicutes bacterium]|nr:tRNA N6-adenosine threonylcarbamoyltransferase [candidate division NPL-UPA2 bacterium]
MTGVVLGVDTSNYMTSAALVSLTGEVLADRRKVLPVPNGAVGLRQSDALFLHIKQWPEVLAGIPLKDYNLLAVAASGAPRAQAGSYMPVFLAGHSLAQSVAYGANVPLFTFSHQAGHLRAALSHLPVQPTSDFLAVQVSGGTTDVLFVSPGASGGYAVRLLGSSVDLHAGQFIDRVGVRMGAQFPCGMFLDGLAQSLSGEPHAIPSSVKGGAISFAGPATAAIRALDNGVPPAQVALGVFRCIANSLEKVLRFCVKEHRVSTVVLCGGVAANSHIRARLVERMRRLDFLLAPEGLAGDNAVGTALLGLEEAILWQQSLTVRR